MTQLNIVHGTRSEIGRRPTNDDCVLVDQQRGLYVLCDGAKGKFGGRTAGELACQVIAARLDDLTAQIGAPIPPDAEAAVDAVLLEAHQQILEAKAADPALEGMTSTAVVVIQRGAEVLLTHVGDSRAFLQRQGQLVQLTRDHNLGNYLADNPQVRAKGNMSPKTLIRALGLKSSAQLQPEHQRLQIDKGDLMLLCSDGLTDTVPALTLQEILACTELDTIPAVVDRLVRAALSHGSMDNISAVVMQIADVQFNGGGTAILDVYDESVHGTLPIVGWLTFHDGPLSGQVIPLDATNVIGASPGCKIPIQANVISSQHAEIFRTEHGFVIRDLGSTNGTHVNNVKVQEIGLVDGDTIRLGTEEMIFKLHKIAVPGGAV